MFRGPGVIVLELSWMITLYTLWHMVEMHEMVPGSALIGVPKFHMSSIAFMDLFNWSFPLFQLSTQNYVKWGLRIT